MDVDAIAANPSPLFQKLGISQAEVASADISVVNCLQAAHMGEDTLMYTRSKLADMLACARLDAAEITARTIMQRVSPVAQSTAESSQCIGSVRKRDAPSSAVSMDNNSDVCPSNAKGLKGFSIKVCEAVESRGVTTYTEVADAVVHEHYTEGKHDEKNIRRRVYDALNVLTAIGAIEKDKKEIKWLGWPQLQNTVFLKDDDLKAKRLELAEKVEAKQNELQDFVDKAYCLSNLILRNRDAPFAAMEQLRTAGLVPPSCLPLPFLLVRAPAEAEVEFRPSDDQLSATLDMQTWEPCVHDDESLLRMLGLGVLRPELLAGSSCTGNDQTHVLLTALATAAAERAVATEPPSLPSGLSTVKTGHKQVGAEVSALTPKLDENPTPGALISPPVHALTHMDLSTPGNRACASPTSPLVLPHNAACASSHWFNPATQTDHGSWLNQTSEKLIPKTDC